MKIHMMMRPFVALPLLALLLFTTACDSTSSVDEPEPVEVQMAVEVPADPFVGFDDLGRPVGTNAYTFYSLRENAIVAQDDSASTAWDLALKGTTILVNGGTSGPGQGGAQVVEGLFEELTEAPTDGYSTDSVDAFAIPTGSGNGWYNYNPQTQVLSPIPGRVLVIRTADGKYAKLRILNYYKGQPETPTFESEARYYTFEYILQPDGSPVLE